MDTDPTKFEGASRPTKGSEDPQGEFPEHRRREELLELLFAHVADAIFVGKPDGRIIDVNPAALGNDRLTFLSDPVGKENGRSLHFSLPLAARGQNQEGRVVLACEYH